MTPYGSVFLEWLASRFTTHGFQTDRVYTYGIKKTATAAILLLIYFAAGKFGLSLAFVNASASPIWPPTGIALAALLIFGYELWPVILIGAFLVNITTTGTIPSSIAVALGNTLEALLGAYLVRRFAGGRDAMNHPANVFKFAILGGLTSTAVSATIGVTSLCLTHLAAWSAFSSVWLTWWLGDSTGALTWTPLLLLWSTRSGDIRGRQRWLEMTAFAACLLVVGEIVLGGYSPLSIAHYPVGFLFVPLLVWPAFRFGPRGTAATILFLSTATIWRTMQGFGPFVRVDENQSLLLLQAFTGVISVTMVAVAALVSERAENYRAVELLVRQRTAAVTDANAQLEQELRRRSNAEADLRASEERYRLLFKRSVAGICVATPEGALLECNDSFAQMLGYDSAKDLENLRMEAIYLKPEERPELIARLLERGRLNNVELCCRAKNGSPAWLLSNLTVLEGANGSIIIHASVVDISEIKRAQEELHQLSSRLMRSQDDERRRIARELHDSAGQYLVSVSMALNAVSIEAKNLPASLERNLQEASEMTKACMAEIRTISYLLHPPLLEELGLASAARWYVEGFVGRSGIQLELEIPEQLDRLGSDIELVLFRVLQESLTNIHRHSGSKTATIRIGLDSRQVWLEVQDQGRDNSNAQVSTGPFRPGVGINGMRERVKGLGGILEISSNTSGTRLKAMIPLPAKPNFKQNTQVASNS